MNLKKYKNNPRKTWNTIKSLLPVKTVTSPISFDNSKNPESVLKISNKFNEYFCIIRRNLAQQIPKHDLMLFKTYLRFFVGVWRRFLDLTLSIEWLLETACRSRIKETLHQELRIKIEDPFLEKRLFSGKWPPFF